MTSAPTSRRAKAAGKTKATDLAGFVKESIADPNAYIAKGFAPGVMPQELRRSNLSPKQFDALIAFLTKGGRGLSERRHLSRRHARLVLRPARRQGGSVWTRPGWWRALLWTIVALDPRGRASRASIRYAVGWPWFQYEVISACIMFLAPMGFLIGIGCFDYWARYMVGAKLPEGHADHGAYSWRDYFKVNTDHKVIGIQYLVTTFVFFLIGGMLAEAFRAQLASPDEHVLRGRRLQRPDLDARVDHDLPVHHPGLRRPGELRRAADARGRGHGLPAAQRALVLDAADGRHHHAR